MSYGTPEYWERRTNELGLECADLRRQLDDALAAINRGEPSPLKTLHSEIAETNRLHAELGDAMRHSIVVALEDARSPAEWATFLTKLNRHWQDKRAAAYAKARANVAAQEESAKRGRFAAQDALDFGGA